MLVLLGNDSLLSLEEGLSVLVELEHGDNAVGRVDWDLGLGSYRQHQMSGKTRTYRWSSL